MNCCYVGLNSKNGECHKLSYSRKKGFKQVHDYNEKQLEILFLRAEIPYPVHFSSIDNFICYHHDIVLMNKFETRHGYCCDPFNVHKDTKVSGRKAISLEFAKQLNVVSDKHIKPGYKLCPRCQSQLSKLTFASTSTVSDSRTNYDEAETSSTSSACYTSDSESMDQVEQLIFSENAKTDANKSLAAIGESPINLHCVSKKQRTIYCTKKLKTASKSLATSFADAACVDAMEVMETETTTINKTEDQQNFSKLLEELQIKFNLLETTSASKVQILTLKPASWSTKKTMEFFKCSKYLVNKASQIKQEKGIMALPVRKNRDGISDETKAKVVSIYEDDEYSRILPGTKDKVSIGREIYQQKRLLLCNVKELYSEFQQKFPNSKIGLSRFFELKPKWCVAPGASGTHRVCVCSIHQNAMLLADACEISYRQMMAAVVCDVNSKICMIHRCENCPGEDNLVELLQNSFDETDDIIHFQQWESTDRTQIVTMSLPVDEFIENVTRKISSLTSHSFIAKCQAKYLKSRKESLHNTEAIILLDFAENYQFVIQDEIQSFHWNKDYCTVHPAVLYLKQDEELIEKSFCVLSNDVVHDTAFVWMLQKQLMQYITENIPHIKFVEYFSDGCAGQYKNYKNFLNLTHHQSDFDIGASWSFFATSHGKSPCDGIGGVVKRKLSQVSLTRKASEPILSSSSAFECCKKEFKLITFFHFDKTDVESSRKLLNDRYLKGSTVIGTRSFHHFYPIDEGVLEYKRTSDDECAAGSHCFFTVSPSHSLADFTLMSYVACNYDEKWWVGMILELDQQNNDMKVTFMHPHGPSKSFFWPRRDDVCWMPPASVILKLSSPSTVNGRSYTFNSKEMDEVKKLLK